MEEPYLCRDPECSRSFETAQSRGVHETQKHNFKEILLEQLREIDDRVDRPPKARDLNESTEYSSESSYRRHFGTWNNALEELGFDTRDEGQTIYYEADDSWDVELMGPGWEQQRQYRLEFDSYECQVCQHDGTVHVHHITPRRVYWHDEFREWAHVNDLSNLITLCESCHTLLEGTNQYCNPSEFARRGREQLGYTESNESGRV